MAQSKNQFNIVLGATIDKSTLQQQLDKISQTKIKINIDTEHLRSQIQSALSGIKLNVSGTTASSGTVKASGSSTPNIATPTTTNISSEKGIAYNRSTVSTLVQDDTEIKKVISGYDELGRKVTEYYRLAQDGSLQLAQTTIEEGNLLNKNNATYTALNEQITQLGVSAGESSAKVQELQSRLGQISGGKDEYAKQASYQKLAKDIAEATAEQQKLETQTTKNKDTFDKLDRQLHNLRSSAQITKEQFQGLKTSLQNISHANATETDKAKQYTILSENIKKATAATKEYNAEQQRLTNISNKNEETLSALSTRLKNLEKNGQIAAKQAKELNQRLEEATKIKDPVKRQAYLKETSQLLQDSSKHAMTFGEMLKTAFSKFGIWSIATVNKLPSLNLSNLTQGCAVKLC